MMVWRYEAIDVTGQQVTGTEAGGVPEVKRRLKDRGLIVVVLTFDPVRSLNSTFFAGELDPARLVFFFRDFAAMLSAGLSIRHVISTFRDTGHDAGMARACDLMLDDLAAGRSLAESMARAGIFTALALHAVKAGEKAGRLPEVMGLLADHFELSGGIKSKCLEALLYPAFVLVFLLVAFIYVAHVVVPQLANLLPQKAMEGPFTQAMLGMSHAFKTAGLPVLVTGCAAVTAAAAFIRHRPRLGSRLAERIPVLGVIYKDLQISVGFFDLYILLKSGIPLDSALKEAAHGQHTLVQHHFACARDKLTAGYTLTQALAACGYFPDMVIQTMRLGEDMGRYDAYCERVFRFYYQAFARRMQILAAWVQPVMLGICGFFVMAMAIAFLKPIYANLSQIGVLR